MYLSSEQTKVPGGYIVQSKVIDEDGDVALESIVFTTMEGVIEYLQSYFSGRDTLESSDSDGDGGSLVLTREPPGNLPTEH